MSQNERAGQTLAKKVPAGGTGTISVPVSAPATIEALKLRIYAGAENTLQLRPEKKSDGGYEDLLEYAASGKHYVDGDDDVWEWELSVPMQKDDEVVIRYENTDGTNPHNFRATVDVDYAGGVERALGLFKGVFA